MNPKRILLAADASENARRAASYLGKIIGSRKDFHIQILYVIKYPDKDLFPDQEAWQKKKNELVHTASNVLKKLSELLKQEGVPVSSVTAISTEAEGFSVAQTILNHQKKNDFGTIVVGRRGVSKAEEFLFGSVSNKIVHYAKDCAVWIIE